MAQKTEKSFRVVIEAYELIEDGFTFVTGEYDKGGRFSRNPNSQWMG